MKRIFLLTLGFSIMFLSCKKEKTIKHGLLAENLLELQSFTEDEYKYIITEVEVDGVKVGDKISTHRNRLTKVSDDANKYLLESRNKEKIGFVYLDTENPEIIRIIEITSSKYKTPKGISVGSSFKKAKKEYPESETHGNSEEKKTVLMAGDYHFLLEGVNFESYKVDESKIPGETKIKKIIIRK